VAISAIDASSAASNFLSLCPTVSLSVSALEKLAITRDDSVAVEAGAGDDAAPHLVRGRAPTLVEGGDETRSVGELVGLLAVHGSMLPELLTVVGGSVFTHAIEQTFEHGGEQGCPEVGDGSGACPEEGAG
jgi:hypothetical protein